MWLLEVTPKALCKQGFMGWMWAMYYIVRHLAAYIAFILRLIMHMCKNRLTEDRVGPPGGVDGEAPVVGAEVEVGRLQLLRPLRAAHEDRLVHAEPVGCRNPNPNLEAVLFSFSFVQRKCEFKWHN